MRDAATLDAPSTAEDAKGQGWKLALVLALTAIALSPSLWGELVYDDLVVVARNPLITSFARLPELFSGALWDFLDPDTANRVGYWRPMASLALVLGYRMGGGEAWAFHVLSILFHLAATAMAWRLALRLTHSRNVALISALLFGLHPVHVESVAWISALNDPLFGFFALAALDAFVRFRDRASGGSADSAAHWFPWGAGVLCLCALLSKELAIAIVPIAVVIDVAKRLARKTPASATDGPTRWFAAYVPLLTALACYYLLRVFVFGGLGAGFERTTTDFGVSGDRLLTLRIELLGGFLWLCAWPFELNLFRPFTPKVVLTSVELLRAMACIAVAAWLTWRAYSKRRSLAFLFLAFLPAALSPALVRVEALGTFPLSERFLYLAVFGFTTWIALTMLSIAGARVGSLCLVALAAAYGVRSFERTRFWHDETVLFTRSAAQNPKSPTVQWGLGRVLLQNYKRTRDPNTLDAARKAFEAALDLLSKAQQGDATIFSTRDDHVQANLGLAWALLFETEFGEYSGDETAYQVFRLIASRYPDNEQTHTGLGAAAMSLGRLDEAEKALRHAIALNDRYVEAWHNLGLLEMQREHWREAAAAFEAALRLRPEHLDDLLWLTRAWMQAGDDARAREVLARASQRYPNDPGPMVLEATMAAQKGDFAAASSRIGRALEIDPDNGDAMLLRGKVLAALGEKAGAERAFLRATELLTRSFEAHYNAAALLLESTGPAAAQPYLIRAYELRPPQSTAGDALRDVLVKAEIDDADQLWRLASIDAERGLDDSALDWLARALSVKPDHGPSHFLRGSILRKRGEVAEALRELELACESMKESYAAHEALGALLAQENRIDEALAAYGRALELAKRADSGTAVGKLAIEALQKTIDDLRKRAGPSPH